MIEIKYINSAKNLIEEWDQLADNYYQKKEFLLHSEKYNYCNQRYYLLFDNDKLMAAAIMYSLRLDLLTFVRLKSPIKMNIIGIPASVSSQGIFGKDECLESLKNHIYKKEKGFILFINLENKPINTFIASGKTLPTIILENKFESYSDYKSALKHNYRRRLNKLSLAQGIEIKISSCSNFNKEMHNQYLAVYNNSKDKLEKLSLEFFKNLPANFILTIISKEEKVLGWNIALEDNENLYFFLGGIDYQYNKSNNTYFSLLSLLVKYGIDKGFTTIDLGQTAEIPKMRTGGKVQNLYMEAAHSNKFLNFLLKKFSNKLEYTVKLEDNKVFKTEEL